MPRVAHAHATPSAPRPLQTTSARKDPRGLATDLQKVRNTSDRAALHSALEACVETDDAVGAERTLQDMRKQGVKPGPRDYAMAMGVNARFVGYTAVVEALAEAASRDGVRMDTRICNARIQALGSARNTAGAREVFEKMPPKERDVDTYDALVAAHLRVKDWQQALKVVQGMLQPGALPKPNESIFITMIEALGDAGQPALAVALFDRMPEAGVAHDWCSAAAAMEARAKAHDVAGTIKLLRQMQEKGVCLGARNYDIAIDACGQDANLYEALALLDEMKQSNKAHLLPTIRTYNATLRVCAMAGNLDKALKLHREMSERGLRPDRDTDVALAAAYAGSGRIDGAIELIEEKFPDTWLISIALRGFRDDSRAAARWLVELLGRKRSR